MDNGLKQQLDNIPSLPGVYFFKDAKGKIIYIGKAVNLKARVKSYFVANSKWQIVNSNLKSFMIGEITKIDYKITETEIDALILESQFIKKYRPRYNVLLKDDKNYFFVVITNDKFPKVYITHQPNKKSVNSNWKLASKDQKSITNYKLPITKSEASDLFYLGPYTDGTALKITLRYLRKIFPYCTCKSAHNIPCLKSHLGLCMGVCCLKGRGIDAEQTRNYAELKKNYIKNIKMLIAILSGKRKNILNKLEKEMKVAVKNEDFEKAAKTRDRISGLKNVFEHRVFRFSDQIKKSELDVKNIKDELQKLFGAKIKRIEFYDISNIQGELATGSMVVFDGERINPSEYRRFKIKTVSGADDPLMMSEILMRRLNHKEWGMTDLIIVDGGITQLNATKKVLNQYKLNIKCMSLAKNPDRLFLNDGRQISLKDLPEDFKLFLQRLRDEAHRFAISYHKKLRHKKLKEEFSAESKRNTR